MLRDMVRLPNGQVWWRTLPSAYRYALANVEVFGGRRRLQARRIGGDLLWRVRKAPERVSEPCS